MDPRKALGADDPFSVSISLTRTRIGTLTQRLDRAIAEGRIETHADRHALRQDELIALADEVFEHTQPLVDHIRSSGGEVTFTCHYLPCLTARLTPDMIGDLETRYEVLRMGTLEPSNSDTMNGISFNGYTKLNLEVEGYRVTTDIEGCGTNNMRVYITYMAGDNARNDANDPNYNASNCEGV